MITAQGRSRASATVAAISDSCGGSVSVDGCVLRLPRLSEFRVDRLLCAQDKQTISEIDTAWSQALHDKDLDGVMSNYVEDSNFLAPDEPIVRGQANIRDWFTKRFATPGDSARFAPTTIVLAKSCDIACELGTFRVSVDNEPGKPVEYMGKHLVTWEKRGGHWKVTAESIDRDSPARSAMIGNDRPELA
jgi:ketosteroid isomerase-like protein